MTDESAASLEKIDQYASALKIPWPIGYGAGKTTSALQIPGYPTTFVIGRDGKVVWNSFQMGTLAGAIEKAL